MVIASLVIFETYKSAKKDSHRIHYIAVALN